MSDPDGDDEWIKDRIAFEALFPPEAFRPIAHALGKSAEPQNLKALRNWLLPYFDLFSSGTGKEPSRAERLKSLVEFRDAARTLLDPVLRRRLGILWLTRDALGAASDQQFKATLQRLADQANAAIEKLSKLGRTGPPKKNAAFRELAPELVYIYERITEQPAGKPYWLPDSRAYGGAFYEFAVEVWRCLFDRLPKARNILPKTEAALAEELKRHWPKEHAGE
jgi:hypothetical protein